MVSCILCMHLNVYSQVNRNERVRDRGQVKVVNISRMNISYMALCIYAAWAQSLMAVRNSVCTSFHTCLWICRLLQHLHLLNRITVYYKKNISIFCCTLWKLVITHDCRCMLASRDFNYSSCTNCQACTSECKYSKKKYT